ncbi:MAG: hypothetical protein ABI772_08030 [Bacteroidota bacterium]
MKILLIAASLLISINVSAQVDPLKYFTDAVSFSFDQNVVTIKRGRETKVTTNCKYIARIEDDQIKLTEMSVTGKEVNNADGKIYMSGEIANLNLNKIVIEDISEPDYVTDKMTIKHSTIPAVVFRLALEPVFGLPPFSTYNESVYVSSSNTLYMYFPSQAAAEEVLTLLKAKQEDIKRGYKEVSRTFEDFVPTSNCGTASKRYINKKYGFTLCLDEKENAEELSYENYNYQFLKDFVLVKGFSDLPFYICPIINKTENDVKVLFTTFEDEFFDRIGAQNFTSKTIYKDEHKDAVAPDGKETQFRGYTIMLTTGDEANVCFEYLLGGSVRFQALCFAYMAPPGIPGLSYSFKNSARILECKPFHFIR